uniref:Calmodulin-like protein 4 n=2 Tax=Culex pipiens TaxID=7175 RepID=A0A8D8GME8_CULPI
MARYFKEQDIDEFRECFYLFARSGHITSLDELTVIFRSLGLSPTINELTSYLKNKNGRMSFADFLEVIHMHSRVENLPEEVIAAFKAGDKGGRGHIPARQLRHLLQNWGEGLSFREVSGE